MLFISSGEDRMTFHVFLFLLVFFLLVSLLWLFRLNVLHRGFAHSRAGVVHLLLKPRTPLDCPACHLSHTFSSRVEPAHAPVRPWREVKSRRGAVQRFTVVDNSDFTPSRLTVHSDSPYDEENCPCYIFQAARIVMGLHVFLFLLVSFLLLGVALLWRLYQLHHQPSHSQAATMRTTVQRLLKARTPVLATWYIRSEDRHFEHD
jgi:hypothetical protein